MKPKPPTPTNTSNKPLPRPIKVPIKKQNGETSKTKRDIPKDDFSILMRSIDTSASNVEQIIKLFKKATPEILNLITNECSVILECKICKNLFRSVANFMTHKRGFCLGKFEQLFQNHEHTEHIWYSKCRKSKVVSSRSTTKKDVLALVETMKSVSTEHDIPEHVLLKDMVTTNEALFNLRYEAQEAERAVEISSAETPDVNGISDDSFIDNICNICNKEFSSQKALDIHIKKNHENMKTIFTCPCCRKWFANTWSVYRHLYKVHRKSNDQVRKLRQHIKKRQVTNEEHERSKKGQSPSPTEEKNQDKAFMEDLKGHESIHRCSECGKRFERKVALISHVNHCHKRINAPADLLRALKRKSLSPMKAADEKKSKLSFYTDEEMIMRIKALDPRVVLRKSDLPPMYRTPQKSQRSPRSEDEIESLVQTYQANNDSITFQGNVFEDILNKIHSEVTLDGSNYTSDSELSETVKECSDKGVKNKSPERDTSSQNSVCMSQDEESLLQEGEAGEIESEEDGSDLEEVEDDETENYKGKDESDTETNIQETESIGSDNEDEANDEEDNEADVSDNNSDDDIDASPSSDDDFAEENELVKEDVTEQENGDNDEDNGFGEVDEENIETQEISPDNSDMLLDDNELKNDKRESHESVNKENKSVIKLDDMDNVKSSNDSNLKKIGACSREIRVDVEGNNSSNSPGYTNEFRDMDDVDFLGFFGFSDTEQRPEEDVNNKDDDSNSPIDEPGDVNHRKNKSSIKGFESLSEQGDSNGLSLETVRDNCSDERTRDDFLTLKYENDNTFPDIPMASSSHDEDIEQEIILSSRYDLDEHNYGIGKEIILSNDAEGVCLSNFSNYEVVENIPKSVKGTDATCNDLAMVNGISSPLNEIDQDEDDSSVDSWDWVTKKINSLMNGRKKKCLLCSKTFHRVNCVRRHIASHYNICKFQCRVNSCDFKSYLRSDMTSHLTKVHKKKEFSNYFDRIFPKKEYFDDRLYNPDPTPIYASGRNSKTNNIEYNKEIDVRLTQKDESLSQDVNESMNSNYLLDDLELSCVEEPSEQILRYKDLEGGLSSLNNQEPGKIKALMMEVIFGSKTEDKSEKHSVTS